MKPEWKQGLLIFGLIAVALYATLMGYVLNAQGRVGGAAISAIIGALSAALIFLVTFRPSAR